MLREVIVKIGLQQEDDKEGIIVEALLDSQMTKLVISLEFARKNKYKKKKLNRLIYKGYKERMEMNVIGMSQTSFSLYLHNQ